MAYVFNKALLSDGIFLSHITEADRGTTNFITSKMSSRKIEEFITQKSHELVQNALLEADRLRHPQNYLRYNLLFHFSFQNFVNKTNLTSGS